MFTGIVQAMGTIARVEPHGGDTRLVVDAAEVLVARGDLVEQVLLRVCIDPGDGRGLNAFPQDQAPFGIERQRMGDAAPLGEVDPEPASDGGAGRGLGATGPHHPRRRGPGDMAEELKALPGFPVDAELGFVLLEQEARPPVARHRPPAVRNRLAMARRVRGDDLGVEDAALSLDQQPLVQRPLGILEYRGLKVDAEGRGRRVGRSGGLAAAR
jgi:hypothetical protein